MEKQLLDSHQFIQLSDGRCHYRIDGPESGSPILLIHGATVPLWEFDRIVTLLTEAGFRTIRLDLFGHGYSERPDKPHTFDFFTKQVFEFLNFLNLNQKIYLLGHSMGAVVAAKLILQKPEKFNSLIMVAPVLNFFANQSSAKFLRVPLLGEWLVKHYVIKMLIRRRTKRYCNIEGGRFVKLFHEQINAPNFGRSLLYLMRGDTLTDQSKLYHELNKLDKAILVLRGSQDIIITAKQIERIKMLMPGAKFAQIENTAHAMILSDPERVAPYMISFLNQSD